MRFAECVPVGEHYLNIKHPELLKPRGPRATGETPARADRPAAACH